MARTRLDLLLAEAAALGIRVVPPNPGPEFARVPYACDLRPDRCGECASSACQYGQTPGLADTTERPRRWWTVGKSAKRRPARAAAASASIDCALCPWSITAPDLESAAEAYQRHLDRAHPGAGDDMDPA